MAKKNLLQKSMTKQMSSFVKQAANIEKKMKQQRKTMVKQTVTAASEDKAVEITIRGDRKVTDVKLNTLLIRSMEANELEKAIMDTMNEANKMLDKATHTITEDIENDLKGSLECLVRDKENMETDSE